MHIFNEMMLDGYEFLKTYIVVIHYFDYLKKIVFKWENMKKQTNKYLKITTYI